MKALFARSAPTGGGFCGGQSLVPRGGVPIFDVSGVSLRGEQADCRVPGHRQLMRPSPEEWLQRYSKLDPQRCFLERRMAEKPDITMAELACELATVGITE